MIEKKYCGKCRKLKDFFIGYRCKQCNKNNSEEYRENNPVKTVEIRKRWDAVNRNEYQRNYKKKQSA